MSKFLLRPFLLWFSLVTLFISSLLLTSLIPTSLLRASIGNSLETLKPEGTYPSFGLPFRRIALDNYTDALILNTAYSVDNHQPFRAALFNFRKLLRSDESDQIKNLDAHYREQTTSEASYERYWHGYLVVLRPLLLLFSYSQVRFLLFLALLTSFGYLLYQTTLHKSWAHVAALLIAAIYVDFFYLGQSIQFSQVFLIGIGASLWYLKKKDHLQDLTALFFITGALTSFFDLLTAPLVTLGFLLIVTTDPNHKKPTLLNICWWVLGYSLLWVSKWVLVELIFAPGAMSDALGHVLNRTVHEADPNFSHLQAVLLNIRQLIGYARSNKFGALFIAGAAGLFFFRYRKLDTRSLQRASTWAMIAALPYGWYLVAANHSYLHVWFTYRAQFLSVAAAVLLYSEVIDWKNVWLLFNRQHFKPTAQRRQN
jgi:hypothetical protein